MVEGERGEDRLDPGTGADLVPAEHDIAGDAVGRIDLSGRAGTHGKQRDGRHDEGGRVERDRTGGAGEHDQRASDHRTGDEGRAVGDVLDEFAG